MQPLPPFSNEPVLELRRATIRAELSEALERVNRSLPLRVPVSVGADTGSTDRPEFASADPGAPGELVASAAAARSHDVEAAVACAEEGAAAWAAAGARERARVLLAAASWLRDRRLELAALEVRECAKPWPEADADVCEAIDFLEYYARGAVELEAGRPVIQVPGERNELKYVPRGVSAVIAPWNFPLAIPCGMSAAALATGNSVVLKPAEQSPACGWQLVQALRAGGVPPQAISLLPGAGDVGAALVGHPRVQTIAFTGSLEVGLEIVKSAAQPVSGQRHLKRVVAELGGKNCVIVDADADLDEAVPAIIGSAFAYGGQKCSAAARVIAHEAVADALVKRLAGAVELLVVGQASDFATVVSPLIEQAAQERVRRYAALAEVEGRVVARGPRGPEQGWFCEPVLAAELASDSPVLRDEIFGPLLTVERVASVAEACDVVDGLPYGLTGGLFSRDPATVRYVSARIPVGNLYVNRGITGAMVGRQPFGGNRLSGTGAKAGGPDYLLQFVEPRVLSENTMRHGLVV